ncbi:exopolyphosphatase / guanosine-5'-triphosphate,3'-diphosphate pyrophosphatase [Methylacidimicrobium cyclopophantes]|uniref:Exopolyphosphatase / guanosine-5'-triphosphate,3'-diphosphate pyrophosphatase n=1 Tax=Methylacidimicrobium cyclopophantes TaxID=1041766 RepID=A0A5E6MIA8_9BACT|nr:exopolyphosphatase [Methylacidimicrobium cyclopophantes]VVM08068.1 exopolyphosphatase / guanosine-5'-triphosphate,3'-diphosphate pyrophosphatase [Methylacidimicrobium cyclopophantes]
MVGPQSPPSGRWQEMPLAARPLGETPVSPRYAVFDIGSNSVKFLVAEWSGSDFRVLDHQSFTTRLVEGVLTTGELAEDAVARTEEVLRRLQDAADRWQADRRLAAATSAVRDSRNRKQFLKRIGQLLDCPVLLLSGEEEADITFQGVAADPALQSRDLLVTDVGGGSSQWIQGRHPRIETRRSLPLGCIRVRDRFVCRYPIGGKLLASMLLTLEKQIQEALRDFSPRGRALVAVGGTATSLAALIQELPQFDLEKLHLFSVETDTLQRTLEELSRLDLPHLQSLPGVPSKRADIFVPGIAVFFSTLAALGLDGLTVSVRGLRHGLVERLRQSCFASFS